MVKYIEVPMSELNRIEPMWRQLISHLQEQSNEYKEEFSTKKFSDRIAPYLHKIRTGKSRLIIAQVNNQDIGYCLSSINEHKIGEVDSIFLDNTYRNQGIGDYFMKDALTFFDRYHTVEDILSVSEGNEDVMKFYERHDFHLRYYVLKRKR